MDWSKLISNKRYQAAAQSERQRSPYQRDADRIIFSAAFRRLQDKTQVHPFPDSDYVRRRLTHSLEVSSVGRSLGTNFGYDIISIDSNMVSIDGFPLDLGQIVANACLAHDIGNPPLGHAGEKAIASWFKENLSNALRVSMSSEQILDLEKFEGNAQGFRLLTRLQDSRNDGGLCLTYATLAAFTKYPTTSTNTDKDYVGSKKHGMFIDDKNHFDDVANEVGLNQLNGAWRRHPLAFLMEAADDICYSIIDIEDAFKLGRLSYAEVKNILQNISGHVADDVGYDDSENISWLRAKAIGALIDEVGIAAKRNLNDMISGSLSKSLMDCIPAKSMLIESSTLIRKRVFEWERIISAEIAGTQMITDVLGSLINAIENPKSHKNQMLLKIVPKYDNEASAYRRILSVTDYISGMTDSYLQKIHKRVTGHSIF